MIRKLFGLLLCVAWLCFAAISNNTVFEVRTDGSDTNGGGFVTGASGTNWTLQAAAQYAVTDAVTAGTTTITSATANFGTDAIGNLLYIQGGTGAITAGWYEIKTRVNVTTITVDRSTGLTTGTGATLNIGGALASLGQAGALVIVRNTVYVKNGTYTISTASTNVSGGAFDGSTAAGSAIIGYQTTRTPGNTGTRPILQVAAALSNCRIFKGNSTVILNLELDGNSQTNSTVADGTFVSFYRCIFRNFTGANSATGRIVGCLATGNSAAQFNGAAVSYACEAYGNTATPFAFTSALFCLSYNNTGASTSGFSGNSSNVFYNSVAYGNGSHGFDTSDARGGGVVNCYAEGNTGAGFNFNNAGPQILLVGSGGFNNTGGLYVTNPSDAALSKIGEVIPTATVFTAAGSNDFSLNNTAAGGALLRALGYPLTTFPRGLTATQMDIGASQVVPAGGSGGGSAVYAMQQRIKQLIAGEQLLENITVNVK